MDGNGYSVGDILVEIDGRHMCRIVKVDVENGLYLCEWLTYPSRMKDYGRFEDINRYYVKVN